ncbi:MAG: DUF6785 family protein [Armatimonadia bacterium]
MSSVLPDPAHAHGDPTPHEPHALAKPYHAATLRAIVVAIILSLLISAWTKQAELVTLTSQISESTPPIASILALFLLIGFGGLCHRIADRCTHGDSCSALGRLAKRLRFSPGEILVVFIFLAITAAMPGVGLFRQVMPCLMVTQYFGMPTNHLTEMSQDIPWQWAPTDTEVARVFWEGGDANPPTLGMENVPIVGPVIESAYRFLAGPSLIPWRIWLVPFLLWSGYLSAYFVTAFCLITLFRRSWEEDERLTFPVSSFAVEMIRPEGSLLSGISFFRDPVMWIGFGLAILYNGMNAMKVFNPAIPALGISYPLASLFTESPWDTMRGLSIFYKPEILGLGYLVPSDVLFSCWFFSLMAWLVRPFAKMVGYQPPGFPFMTQQAMGAFILLGIYFLYQGRNRLMQIARRAVSNEPLPGEDQEPLNFKLAFWAAVVGIFVIITMPIMFGVVWWMSAMYFGLMLIVLLVYCRNRAEMGFPIVWGYPLYEQRPFMVNFLGTQRLLPGGDSQSLTLLTMFSWLQRSVNQAITSIGVEGYVAASRLGQSRRTLAKVVIAALIFGLITAFLVNLSSYYEYGGLVLSSPGGTEGGQMTQEVLSQFTAISQWLDKPEDPNQRKMAYTIVGGVMALGMILGRRASVRFPFHAGAYALSLCHGSSFIWFPCFLLWIIKSAVLHLGGIKLYRRIAPGFLAFTLGHFFATGIWSLVGLLAGEWVKRYIVWFL